MDNSHIIKEIIVQMLGFGIVLLVLRKFAWKNLLGMIDTRRKKIEDEFKGIEEQKKSLEALEKDYRGRIERIEQEARVKIQEAANIGLALAKDIQDKARQDAEKMVSRAQAEIEQDIARAKLTLRNQIVELSGLMTEKIIREKLDAKEHEKLVDKFIKELEMI